MKRRFITAVILTLLIPYIMTLMWTGRIVRINVVERSEGNKTVILDRNGFKSSVDVEEYLVGMIARQISGSYEIETLKAQAIIARTYVYRLLGDDDEIEESMLMIDESEPVETKWVKKLEEAVQSTSGIVICSGDSLIEPLFHKVSAGSTRNSDEMHPYLMSVKCDRDVEAENFLKVITWSYDDFTDKINALKKPVPLKKEQIPDGVQMVARDAAGYVEKIQIGSEIYTGAEVQQALALPSESFVLENYEGRIRAVCRGIGHGYGFSQFSANLRAKEGADAEELLKFYYKNIVLISE